ncbi:sodium/calcium exchanger NCL1-like isoform X1 [Magnolia sinica]|uniref:sodium/calcium exchanger NCL1-like isoform X1 n=1 Tax=Magnolia sinica TaxID=86752 RepID=UPI002659049F|nr:sodium/calcium exchanger NCL1-like isoform X1 [Magnolia sinica]
MGRAMFSISFIILLLSSFGQSRLVTEMSGDLVSDGIRFLPRTPYLDLEQPTSLAACDQTYGFMPCSSTVIGNIFLVAVYGYLMYIAANYISTGCELLLEVLGPGLVGGLFLPVLGALPDAILVLVSGLSGSKEAAQHQVLIGMGLLAGSTVVLLTLLWGTCIIVGQSEPSTSTEPLERKPSRLTGCGVTTDVWTSHAAKIMVLSVLPFIIIQLPNVFNMPYESGTAILISLIASVILLLSYCLYQVFQPWIQRRRLAYVKHTHVISGILRHFQRDGLGKLLTEDGQPDFTVLRKIFHGIDQDSNGLLSASELRALIIGIQLEVIDLDMDDAVKKIMDEFDVSGDGHLSEDEFLKGISKWLEEAQRAVPNSRTRMQNFLHDFHIITKEEHDKLVDQSDEVVESVANSGWICFRAVLLLLLGTVIAAAFAEPLVHAVDDFSTATTIPSFFIAFLLLPLVSNTSEAVSAISFASRKTQRSSSLTFSEIYGAVTMKNTLCLAVFLALVYIRGLTWTFSAEVLISLIVCVVVGLFASFRTKFPLWTSVAAYALYPSSLALVYVLDYVAGWS